MFQDCDHAHGRELEFGVTQNVEEKWMRDDGNDDSLCIVSDLTASVFCYLPALNDHELVRRVKETSLRARIGDMCLWSSSVPSPHLCHHSHLGSLSA